MKHSVFKTHTSIHFSIQTDTHIGFRTELFKKQLTIQEALCEFARLVADGDRRANKILDELVIRKIQSQIEGLRTQPSTLGELDKDALYNLIHDEKDEDDKDSE